jgi:hypothetical protein
MNRVNTNDFNIWNQAAADRNAAQAQFGFRSNLQLKKNQQQENITDVEFKSVRGQVDEKSTRAKEDLAYKNNLYARINNQRQGVGRSFADAQDDVKKQDSFVSNSSQESREKNLSERVSHLEERLAKLEQVLAKEGGYEIKSNPDNQYSTHNRSYSSLVKNSNDSNNSRQIGQA